MTEIENHPTCATVESDASLKKADSPLNKGPEGAELKAANIGK